VVDMKKIKIPLIFFILKWFSILSIVFNLIALVVIGIFHKMVVPIDDIISIGFLYISVLFFVLVNYFIVRGINKREKYAFYLLVAPLSIGILLGLPFVLTSFDPISIFVLMIEVIILASVISNRGYFWIKGEVSINKELN